MKLLLSKYSDVVTEKLEYVKGVEHKINTGSHNSVICPPYRIEPAWKMELKEEIMRLLRDGIISHSQLPWSAPVVSVRKPNGSIRLCIDHQRLTLITEPDPYIIPRVEETLVEVTEANLVN